MMTRASSLSSSSTVSYSMIFLFSLNCVTSLYCGAKCQPSDKQRIFLRLMHAGLDAPSSFRLSGRMPCQLFRKLDFRQKAPKGHPFASSVSFTAVAANIRKKIPTIRKSSFWISSFPKPSAYLPWFSLSLPLQFLLSGILRTLSDTSSAVQSQPTIISANSAAAAFARSAGSSSIWEPMRPPLTITEGRDCALFLSVFYTVSSSPLRCSRRGCIL